MGEKVMENDIIFKSKLFGGYKKEEVMAYIASLGAEKAGLAAELGSVRAQLASLGAKMREYDGIALDCEAQKLALRQSVENCRRLENDNAALSAELSAKQGEQGALTAKIAELENECKRLSGDCERLRAVETQLGAAMLDARLYSDRLVAEAKEQSVRVRTEVYESIGETVGRIDGLTGSLGQITESFNRAVEEVGLRIRALTGDMSKAAGSLMEGQLSFAADGDNGSAAPAAEPMSNQTQHMNNQVQPASVPLETPEAPEAPKAPADESAEAQPAHEAGVEFITDEPDEPDGGSDAGSSVYLFG